MLLNSWRAKNGSLSSRVALLTLKLILRLLVTQCRELERDEQGAVLTHAAWK